MQVVLLTATALSALANWWSRVTNSDRIEVWAKPLTTMFVIGLALANESPTGQVATAVIALVLCLWGDISLMAPIDNFVLGLASFLIGHVVFVVLFSQYGLPHVALGAVALALMAVLAATAGRRIVSGAVAEGPALRTPVVGYLALIAALARGGGG
ncbi:MAG: lysoplasmalogenase, partial [Ilumatobacteraceae bacterium]|nr:lysoplasmalogenase [Ilumatobacteraceae bacterium]